MNENQLTQTGWSTSSLKIEHEFLFEMYSDNLDAPDYFAAGSTRHAVKSGITFQTIVSRCTL